MNEPRKSKVVANLSITGHLRCLRKSSSAASHLQRIDTSAEHANGCEFGDAAPLVAQTGRVAHYQAARGWTDFPRVG
jgi:hypothetical protein